MAIDNDYLRTLAFQLGEYLIAARCTVTTAESCTGGWVSSTLTDIPGSSSWFGYGFVTYSNQAKTDLLGVDPELIDYEGAVSEQVVRAMAVGALQRANADLAVAVSGIAGPDGGSEEKPVGSVWFGWAERHDSSVRFETRLETLGGDRNTVRRQSVAIALERLIELAAQRLG